MSGLEGEGKVGYRHGDDGAELERKDYLELIAWVTSHIPDKGQVMVRYYGLSANAHRGKVRKVGQTGFPMRMAEEEIPRRPSKGWPEMTQFQAYQPDPLPANLPDKRNVEMLTSARGRDILFLCGEGSSPSPRRAISSQAQKGIPYHTKFPAVRRP